MNIYFLKENASYPESNLGSNPESNKRRRFNPFFFLNQALKQRRFGKVVADAGWPLTALILWPTNFVFKTFPTPLDLKHTLAFIVLGFLSAADNLIYAYLPASTAILLPSSSLVFSTLFGFFPSEE